MSYKGVFKPTRIDKYLGNSNEIIYRSLWEFRVMSYLDKTPAILKWSSEEIAIPYLKPTDRRMHRYFPDFYVETKDNKFIVEVKPSIQAQAPKKPNKGKSASRRVLREHMIWSINEAKWAAAKAFCARQGWTFKVLTEKDLTLGY